MGRPFTNAGKETIVVRGDGMIIGYTTNDIFKVGKTTYEWEDLKDLPHTMVNKGFTIHFRTGDILLLDIRDLDTYEW